MYANITNAELITILGNLNRQAGFRLRTVDNGGTGGFGQVHMAADKIGVEMRLEYIFDGSLAISSHLQVSINIAEGIHNGCFPIAFYVIGSLTDAACVELLNEHKKILLAKIQAYQQDSKYMQRRLLLI
jgi:hypothetical protein